MNRFFQILIGLQHVQFLLFSHKAAVNEILIWCRSFYFNFLCDIVVECNVLCIGLFYDICIYALTFSLVNGNIQESCCSQCFHKLISFTLDDTLDYPRYCQITPNAENINKKQPLLFSLLKFCNHVVSFFFFFLLTVLTVMFICRLRIKDIVLALAGLFEALLQAT